MISIQISFLLFSLIFVVGVTSDDLPILDENTKKDLLNGNRIIDDAVKKIENVIALEKPDEGKAEVTGEVSATADVKPQHSTFTQIIGNFVADLFQIPISILKAVRDVISRLTGSESATVSGSIGVSHSATKTTN